MERMFGDQSLEEKFITWLLQFTRCDLCYKRLSENIFGLILIKNYDWCNVLLRCGRCFVAKFVKMPSSKKQIQKQTFTLHCQSI